MYTYSSQLSFITFKLSYLINYDLTNTFLFPRAVCFVSNKNTFLLEIKASFAQLFIFLRQLQYT